MDRWSRRCCVVMLALAAWGVGCLSVEGAVIDIVRAGAGGESSYSRQIRDIPILWDVFRSSLIASEPAGDFGVILAEPGMGNQVDEARGQVLMFRSYGDREYRMIVDVLAWVTSPQLLYIDPTEWGSFGAGVIDMGAGHQPVSFPGGGNVGSTRDPVPVNLVPPSGFVPEPGTLVLLGVMGVVVLGRRNRV